MGELHGVPQGLLVDVVQENAGRGFDVFLAVLHDAGQVFFDPVGVADSRAVDVVFGRGDAKHAGQQGQRDVALVVAELPQGHGVEQVGKVPGFVAVHVEHGRNGLAADEQAPAQVSVVKLAPVVGPEEKRIAAVVHLVAVANGSGSPKQPAALRTAGTQQVGKAAQYLAFVVVGKRLDAEPQGAVG